MSSARSRFGAALAGCGLLALASCGGSDVPQELQAPLADRVTQLAADASVPLDAEQAECVAASVPLDVAERLAAQSARDTVSNDDAVTVSEGVIECVGDVVIGRAALISQAGGLRETSLDCAAAELDRMFLVQLVAAEMTGTDTGSAEVELQVATAFGLCMETDELLNR